MSCVNLFKNLASIVDEINNQFIDDFTDHNVEYWMSCVKTNITYDKFYELLKEKWEIRVNQLSQREVQWCIVNNINCK